MNGFLAIAATFLDRMTNPRHGTDVNDAYTLRFNQLLTDDTQFARNFAELDLGPEDVGTLPMCAWPWYLKWRTGRADPPSPDFLDALFNATSDPAVQLAVVTSGMSDRGDRRGSQRASDETWIERQAGAGADPVPVPVDDEYRGPDAIAPYATPQYAEQPTSIRSQWLRRRVRRLAIDDASSSSLSSTIEIAAQLLQLGDAESVESLRQLLAIEWPGRRSLHDSVASHLVNAELDSDTHQLWLDRLGIADEGRRFEQQ